MNHYIAIIFLLFMTGSLHAQADGSPSQPALNYLKTAEFCGRIGAALVANRTDVSSYLAADMVAKLRTGQIETYIDGRTLGISDSAAYISTEQLLASALWSPRPGENIRSPRPVILIRHVNDLKHLPFTQQGTRVLLLVDSAAPLTVERANNVVKIAVELGISISTLWYGTTLQSTDAVLMATITSLTGGFFVDLTNSLDPCVTKT